MNAGLRVLHLHLGDVPVLFFAVESLVAGDVFGANAFSVCEAERGATITTQEEGRAVLLCVTRSMFLRALAAAHRRFQATKRSFVLQVIIAPHSLSLSFFLWASLILSSLLLMLLCSTRVCAW